VDLRRSTTLDEESLAADLPIAWMILPEQDGRRSRRGPTYAIVAQHRLVEKTAEWDMGARDQFLVVVPASVDGPVRSSSAGSAST
jgi:hypothetical protein